MNPDWHRWVWASCLKHFDDRKGTLPLHAEGMDRENVEDANFLEFRMNGPRIQQYSAGHFRLEVTINILIQHAMQDADAYLIQKSMGIVEEAFTVSIPVFKYGTPGDDSLLGCFIREDEVKVNFFGQVDKTIRQLQGTVQSMYRMDLKET